MSVSWPFIHHLPQKQERLSIRPSEEGGGGSCPLLGESWSSPVLLGLSVLILVPELQKVSS